MAITTWRLVLAHGFGAHAQLVQPLDRAVPLRSTRRLDATGVLISTFVALWHDLIPRLSAKSWLTSLFILPEVAARKALPPSLVRARASPCGRFWATCSMKSILSFCTQFGDKWWYGHVCAADGMCNVLLMMGANLVGFVIGVDAARYFRTS